MSEISFQPKPITDLIATATVVIDTNVLLQAYQWKGIEFDMLLTQLELLASQRRLIIPSNVIDEFTRNRPDLIKTMENSLNGIIEDTKNNLMNITIQPKSRSLKEICPSFVNSKELLSAEQHKKKIKEELNSYFNSLILLQKKTIDLFQNDSWLDRINKLFRECYYKPSNLSSNEELETEAKRRCDNNIPPGYKDKSKIDPSGDYKN